MKVQKLNINSQKKLTDKGKICCIEVKKHRQSEEHKFGITLVSLFTMDKIMQLEICYRDVLLTSDTLD